jgi:hypothetical protein
MIRILKSRHLHSQDEVLNDLACFRKTNVTYFGGKCNACHIFTAEPAKVCQGTGKDISDESLADAHDPLTIKSFGDSYIEVPVGRKQMEAVFT